MPLGSVRFFTEKFVLVRVGADREGIVADAEIGGLLLRAAWGTAT